MITIKKYQELAQRTVKYLHPDSNRQHMILGVISEFGELADSYKKHLAYDKPFDKVNCIEEISDICWYIANWATFNNCELVKPINIGINPFKNIGINPFNKGESRELSQADVISTSLAQINFQEIQTMLDIVYTMAINLNILEEEFYQGLYNNIEKLKIRYKDKFTNEEALERNLNLERETLEKNVK